jgi:tetratricopeptide (TPR) repeat protein
MSRWLLLLLVSGVSAAQGAQPTRPVEQKTQASKAPVKTSGREEIPREEDASFATPFYPYNPLESKKDVDVGDAYAKKHKYRPAAERYRSATQWDGDNQTAWLKLGETEDKLKNTEAALQAYSKYLELSTEAGYSKTTAKVRERLKRLGSIKR